MQSRIVRLGVPASLWMLFVVGFAAGQGGSDVIVVRDPKSDKVLPSMTGTISKETISGILFKPSAGPEKEYKANEIIRITYSDLPSGVKLEFSSIGGFEDKKEYAKALDAYVKLLPNFKDAANPKSKRFVEYRIAMLKAMEADSDEKKRPEAIEALKSFTKAYPSTWQYPIVAKQLIRLQNAAGNMDGAIEAVEAFLKLPDLTPDLQQEISLTYVDLLMRAGKAKEADAELKKLLATVKPGDPKRNRLDIYKIGTDFLLGSKDEAALKKVEAELRKKTQDGSTPPALKAVAHNILGDCLLAVGRRRDAMWEYLWVDVVYNEDRSQVQKAIDALAKIFEDLKEPEKAKQYREKSQQIQ